MGASFQDITIYGIDPFDPGTPELVEESLTSLLERNRFPCIYAIIIRPFHLQQR